MNGLQEKYLANVREILSLRDFNQDAALSFEDWYHKRLHAECRLEELRRESADRGEPVTCCLMSAREFLAYVGSRELSARFVAGGKTFDVLWCALNDTRDRAALLAEEDAALDGERSA